MKDITLKLKKFGCYSRTSKGSYLYLEHGFKVFVPNNIINKMVRK